MTDTSPSPFRRFPWLQLVFCLACLGMTAWTWMRYSYCWQINASEIVVPEVRSGYDSPPKWQHLDRFVQVKGTVSLAFRRDGLSGDDMVSGRVMPNRLTFVTLGRPDHYGESIVITLEGSIAPPEPGSQLTLQGRVDAQVESASESNIDVNHFIDGTRGRLHPASIAGLVVGAVGCFIFGLYLRRWLRERKSVANTAQPDMLA